MGYSLRIGEAVIEYSEYGVSVDCDIVKAALCRGEWLAYWLRWAVDNCKQPVFVNS